MYQPTCKVLYNFHGSWMFAYFLVCKCCDLQHLNSWRLIVFGPWDWCTPSVASFPPSCALSGRRACHPVHQRSHDSHGSRWLPWDSSISRWCCTPMRMVRWWELTALHDKCYFVTACPESPGLHGKSRGCCLGLQMRIGQPFHKNSGNT